MLTSRKLIALGMGQLAILVLVGFAVFGDKDVPNYQETMGVIGGITTAALGIQGVIDMTTAGQNPIKKDEEVVKV